MKQSIFSHIVDLLFPENIAYAHCDIPCGIYDPHEAQVAAHTVIRMTGLLEDIKAEENIPFSERKKIIHQIARLTKVKEDHTEKVKHEIRVLWADYFKPEHVSEYPNLHELVFKTLKLASKARQEISMKGAEELLASVQKIAEIFWKTKGREFNRVASPYPTGGELVLPK